jgi:hypothetical protein
VTAIITTIITQTHSIIRIIARADTEYNEESEDDEHRNDLAMFYKVDKEKKEIKNVELVNIVSLLIVKN